MKFSSFNMFDDFFKISIPEGKNILFMLQIKINNISKTALIENG